MKVGHIKHDTGFLQNLIGVGFCSVTVMKSTNVYQFSMSCGYQKDKDLKYISHISSSYIFIFRELTVDLRLNLALWDSV